MANEPTEKLAQNAMTTLEDTMERLGIPEDSADTTVKNTSSGLSIPPPHGSRPSPGASSARRSIPTDMQARERRSCF